MVTDGCATDTPHTRHFLDMFDLVHITLWLKVSQRVSDKTTHAHVITCLSVCCFLALSSSFLFSVLLINFHVVESAEE